MKHIKRTARGTFKGIGFLCLILLLLATISAYLQTASMTGEDETAIHRAMKGR